jgi:hypothetical protein
MFGFKKRRLATPPADILWSTENEPTNPLVDLCADIREHPGEYSYDGLFIIRNRNSDIYLGIHSACGMSLTSDEIALARPVRTAFIQAAIQAAKNQSRAALAARLAKLKAERNPDTTNKAEALQAAIDAYIYGKTTIQQDYIFINAVRQMLPVLEGRHRIVPVGPVTISTNTPGDVATRDFLTDPGHIYGGDGHAIRKTRWPDRSGNPHPTRAAQRTADKLIEAKRRDQKAGAP